MDAADRDCQRQALPDWIAAGEISVRERLVDERNWRSVETVGRAHHAARAERHAQCFKVAGRRRRDLRRRQRLTLGLSPLQPELCAEGA